MSGNRNLNPQQFHYHATKAENVPSILENGLRASMPVFGPTGVYGHADEEKTRGYGSRHFGNEEHSIVEYKPVDAREFAGAQVSASVPPENIQRVLPSRGYGTPR